MLDSRRLTGPSLLLDGPGAIIDVATEGGDAAAVERAWRERTRRMTVALGWDARLAARAFPSGVSLAFTAPIDALYAATEVNEWAIAALARGATPGGETEPFEDARARLAAAVEGERSPALIALAAAAERRGVAFLSDTRRVSVGLGAGSRSWPLARIPASPERIRWNGLHDVPVGLVTGTNGKTTTVRLVGAMARAAGVVAGITSTDRVDVGDETVAVGDYSGPNGARTVLRDRRVELAALEVARGGILRRGLPVRRASAAVVTNVANDHVGEYGICDLEALADAKMVVAKAVGANGRVVLNADDPRLLVRGAALSSPVTWFTLDARHPRVVAHVAAGSHACVLEDGGVVLHRDGGRRRVARVADVPFTFGGAALHNVANALAAIGLAASLGLPDEAIAAGLTTFRGTPAENPGRANVWQIDGVRVIVDFAHNPHGLAALAAMAAALPARRRAIVIGQAGDRDDASIAEFAETAWRMKPDRVFIKEMDRFLRGRERGAIPALIEHTLRRAGAPADALSRHDGELEAVRAALEWAQPGDVLLLMVHAEREAVIALVDERSRRPAAPASSAPRRGA